MKILVTGITNSSMQEGHKPLFVTKAIVHSPYEARRMAANNQEKIDQFNADPGARSIRSYEQTECIEDEWPHLTLKDLEGLSLIDVVTIMKSVENKLPTQTDD